MLSLKAPAKLNLTLEILGKRPDGFHEIRSVLQTVELCDKLHFKPSDSVAFECDMPEWSAEASLVNKAVTLMREVTGCDKGAAIKIEKHIPLMSGLGGDSSDAAATLNGLNELWGLNLSAKRLLDMAAQLGSDVTFFLQGGTALAEGRGELVAPLPASGEVWVVLVLPDVSGEAGKTARMYAGLKPGHFTGGQITEKLIKTIKAGRNLDPSMLFNTFENIAFEDSTLQKYKEHLIKMGAPRVHLAGSGPTLFTMFTNKAEAEDLHTRCKDQGIQAYLVKTL